MKTNIKKWATEAGFANVGSVSVKCAAILAVRGKDRTDSGFCLSLVCDAVRPGKMANTSLQECAKRASCVMIGDLNKFTDTIFTSREAALRSLEGFCTKFGVPCAPSEYDEIADLPEMDAEKGGTQEPKSAPFELEDALKRMITITRKGGENAPALIADAAAKLLEGPAFVAFAAAVSAEMEKRLAAAREQEAAVSAAAERIARGVTATESKPSKPRK